MLNVYLWGVLMAFLVVLTFMVVDAYKNYKADGQCQFVIIDVVGLVIFALCSWFCVAVAALIVIAEYWAPDWLDNEIFSFKKK